MNILSTSFEVFAILATASGISIVTYGMLLFYSMKKYKTGILDLPLHVYPRALCIAFIINVFTLIVITLYVFK